MAEYLTCRSCKQTLEVDTNFTKSGIQNRRCRGCVKTYHQQWHKQNADKAAAKARMKRATEKQKAFDAYGGATCTCCGETESHFLSIDHVNNDGYEHRKQIGINSGTGFYTWLRMNGYPEGFQVLCMNCQFGKRLNGGICPHQQ